MACRGKYNIELYNSFPFEVGSDVEHGPTMGNKYDSGSYVWRMKSRKAEPPGSKRFFQFPKTSRPKANCLSGTSFRQYVAPIDGSAEISCHLQKPRVQTAAQNQEGGGGRQKENVEKNGRTATVEAVVDVVIIVAVLSIPLRLSFSVSLSPKSPPSAAAS